MAAKDVLQMLSQLSKEDLQLLKQSLVKEMVEDSDLAPGMTMLYNRSAEDFEFQFDSRVYVCPAEEYITLPTNIARHGVFKSQYRHVGTPNVVEWLVPKGYKGFGEPLGGTGLTGDPVKDYPLDITSTDWERLNAPVPPGKQEVFSLDPLPPRGTDEPPIQARPGRLENQIVAVSKDTLV